VPGSSAAGGRAQPPRWGPWGPWSDWATGGHPVWAQSWTQPLAGPQMVLGKVLDAVRSRFLGRRLTVRLPDSEVTFTLDHVNAPIDVLRLTAGQLDEVVLTASGVRWNGIELSRAVATLRNAHVRPGPTPVLVLAPVDLLVRAEGEVVAQLVSGRRPSLHVAVSEAGVLSVSWFRRRSWARLEVEAGADGRRIWVRPVALVVGSRRWRCRRDLPRLSITVPLPSDALRLVNLEPTDGGVQVRLRWDEWVLPLSTERQDDLLEKLAQASPYLDLSGWWSH